MERRTFLKKSVSGVAAFTVMKGPSPGDVKVDYGVSPSSDLIVPPDGYEPPDWLRYARAIYFDGLTPPIYPHMDDFDAGRLVKLAVDLGGDTLRFQPLAYWAYYPTKSKYPIHPELGNRDLIAETSRACRKAGMHIYCYTKYKNPFMSYEYLDQHPEYLDWVQRDPEGKPVEDFDNLGWMRSPKADATGDAFRNAIHQVVEELCTYDIDGVYFDAPSAFSYTGVCYCDTCRKKFKDATGLEMDRLRNPQDMEALTAWYRWFNEMDLADLLDFRRLIHSHGKFMLCHNGGTWRPQALRQQYRIPDGFMVEQQVQIYRRLMVGLMGAAMARPTRKLPQMYMGSYCLSDFGQPPHVQPWPLENTSEEDGDEVLMEGFTNLACGGAPIYATVNRLYYGLGTGSAHPAQEVYEVMRRLEPMQKDSVVLPYVTVVPSWEALQLWRTNRHDWNVEMSEGFTLAMLDERLNLDVCPSTEVSQSWLAGRQVIALCGASGMTDETANLLARWVERGGGLLATYDTGLYDQNGKLRSGGALQEVLGVDIKAEPLLSQPECFYRVREAHPALGDYHSGSTVKGDSRLLPVEAVGGAKVLADCWNLGTRESRGPAIIVNTYGKGRTVYISGSLEAHYASSRVPSHRRMLASAVRYLAGGAPTPFTLKAPLGVYGVLRQAPNADLALWVLANIGFKDADIGRMRQEFTPVPNIEAGIMIPKDRSVKAAHLVRARRDVPFKLVGGYAVVSLPEVHVAEIVHLELGS